VLQTGFKYEKHSEKKKKEEVKWFFIVIQVIVAMMEIGVDDFQETI
jgi:hypothetical protein